MPRLKPNERAYALLKEVLPNLEDIQLGTHWKLKAPGFMDLVVEGIAPVYHVDGVKRIPLSLTHYYKQNGDMMADPDMQLEIWLMPEGQPHRVIPLTFQQDSLGLFQQVYPKDPDRSVWRPELHQDLTAFMLDWFKNLKSQGHKREVETTAEVK